MTTSSFDRSRCTRISPSAILDDRLAGQDLEWARDHLRRCEACRDRVEDFREMLLRVGRLPSATVSATAMDEAFATSIPDRLRGSAGASRTFQTTSSVDSATVPPPPFTELGPFNDLPPLNDLSSHVDMAPQSVRPEVTSLPDLLSELEREIFRDEVAPDHPAPMTPVPEPIYPTMVEPPAEEVQAPAMASSEPGRVMPPHPEMDELADSESMAPALPDVMTEPLREVPIDSRRDVKPTTPSLILPARGTDMDEETAPLPTATIADVEEEPAPSGPPKKSDTAMRLAVGLGAAATVLLAAVLYEGGWVLGSPHKVSHTASPIATASLHPSPTGRPSASPSATATAPPAPVLFTLGNGVAGDTIFRIRPGTAVAGYTRLVFDMHGGGLPSMVVTQPDTLHVAVTFKNTDATGLPVGGIHTSRVAGVEAPVQQGADAILTIDLVHPVTVNAFTLPATGSYAWRLVVDLHSG